MASIEAKMKRKPNWTQDECLLVATLVNERKYVLRGKLGPNLTSRMKKDAWQAVATRFNASSLTPRSPEEVEKKWHNLLSSAKSEISIFRKSTTATGGGPPSKTLSALAETIQMVLGDDTVVIDGVHGGVDSSLLQLLSEDNNCAIHLLQNDSSGQMDIASACDTSLSPQLSDSPMCTHIAAYTSTRPSSSDVPRRSPVRTSSNSHNRAPSSNQKLIEELTIKKLKMEIEYFDLKVKALKRKLEE